MADVTRIGELSPETFEAEWLPGQLMIGLYWLVAGRARGRTNLAGMRATLERLKAAAEAA